MAKKKKAKKTARFGKGKLHSLLQSRMAKVEADLDAGDIAAAKSKLLQLNREYPGRLFILETLLEVCLLRDEWHDYARHAEQILPMMQGDDRAGILNNLVYVHSELMNPAWAWQYARTLLAEHPNSPFREQIGAFVVRTESFLQQEVGEWFDTTGFDEIERLELAVQHDMVKFYTESGMPKQAISVAEKLLAVQPGIPSVMNNLSLAQLATGDMQAAAATAQQVLAQDPENFHALANLVRYLFLNAQFDEARRYAAILEQVTSDKEDLEVKQAEAFAYLGEDEKVFAAYERAKAKNGAKRAVLLHLAAAASYRLGEKNRAWRLWREAVKVDPNFYMAQESLADKVLPIGERNVPWYWPFSYWVPANFSDILSKHVDRDGSQKAQESMMALLDDCPYLLPLFPHILERGDEAARSSVVEFIRALATPDVLAVLYTFVQSRYGSDKLRLEGLNVIVSKAPHLLPENRQVKMRIDGKWMELLSMVFHVTDEPTLPTDIPEALIDRHVEAYELLKDDQLAAAETIFKEIIAAAPDYVSALNHLALVYERQGRIEESRALLMEIHTRFPDYFFAQISIAQLRIRDHDFDAARELLAPLLRQTEFHVSEFRALARAHIQLGLAMENPNVARQWLTLWRSMDEESDQFQEWEERVERIVDHQEELAMLKAKLAKLQKPSRKK